MNMFENVQVHWQNENIMIFNGFILNFTKHPLGTILDGPMIGTFSTAPDCHWAFIDHHDCEHLFHALQQTS